jgi:L-ascorbate metabolism protein UlaG (beta-lactamase superfamily)
MPATTSVSPTSLPASAPTRSTAAVTIYYEENAQVELINFQGTRVLIDVSDPSSLSQPATDKDVLLTTHKHPDHVNDAFLASFKGQQIFVKEGEIKLPDVTMRGIASAHNASDPLKPENGTNYIYIVDMGGLRIVHFGDIGQDALTPEQLTVLGKVDIAITQFDNSYSNMNVSNKKGFRLMDQVKPRLIIATHNSLDATKYAATHWTCLYTDQPSVTISRADLSDKTQVLLMGKMASSYGKVLNLPKANW